MKRAKLLLAAIAVVAIAGGVYASKAARQNHFIYTPSIAGGICSIKVTGYTFLPNTLPTLLTATTTSTTTCGLTTVFISD